ncbi:TIGR03089 family protein [Actinokineospora guangxiensis]|uniref:TIGR03089 family protein n=1 Tax=Actinokineospora guangxiensis TaxID=1490288 RepID=A0ABW0EYM8_9PSEU
MNLTESLLRGLAPARPAVTHYDDAAGTRVELSAATLANWAAKTANWLVDEHDVEPGDPVAVRLPAHWQTAGVLLGAWWCGAHVVAGGEARVTFTTKDDLAGSGVLAAVSLDPMGRDLGGPVGAAVDFVGEARLFGDDYFAVDVAESAPALAGLSVAEVLAAGTLPAGARVLSTRDWTVPDGVLAALVSPLAAGGSVVQVSSADTGRLAKHRETERTTLDI